MPPPFCRLAMNNYPLFVSSPLNRDGFTLRMDLVESSKSQWTGRYSWGDENQSSTGLGSARQQDPDQLRSVSGHEHAHHHAQSGERSALSAIRGLFNSIGTLSAFTNDV